MYRNGNTVLSDSSKDAQSQDYHIAMVREYCEMESCKESNDLMVRYHEKMSESVHYSLISPSCIIPSSHWQKLVNCWIDPDRIILHNEFGFYHHSPSEIIQHAYDKRSDCDYLIGEMAESASGGLHLAEYPSPLLGQVVYMVKENGNHRSLLFRLLGLPCVKSLVERNVEERWLYAHSDESLIYPYMLLLAYCGLIKNIQRTRFGYEFTLCESGLGIWLLPGTHVRSRRALIANVRKRMALIERVYSKKGLVIPELLHSRLLWLHISKVPMVRECVRSFDEWLISKFDTRVENRIRYPSLLKRMLRY